MKKRLLVLLVCSLVFCFTMTAYGEEDWSGWGTAYYWDYNFDYQNLSNTATVLSPKFWTYEQTESNTCGACCALMVLNHYSGQTGWNELNIRDAMNLKPDQPLYTNQLYNFFKKNLSWKVTAAQTKNATFSNFASFQDWVLLNLKDNTPIMVEWLRFGGHWQVIVGYDTRGTTSTNDDAIILADSWDRFDPEIEEVDHSDGKSDGYSVFKASYFYKNWRDVNYNIGNQQWVIVKPY